MISLTFGLESMSMCLCGKVRGMEMSLVQGVLDLQVLVCHLQSGGLFQVCSFETWEVRPCIEPRPPLTLVSVLLGALTISEDLNSSFGCLVMCVTWASHLTSLGLGFSISKISREALCSFDFLPALRFCGSELTILGESPKKQRLGERREERSGGGSSSASVAFGGLGL